MKTCHALPLDRFITNYLPFLSQAFYIPYRTLPWRATEWSSAAAVVTLQTDMKCVMLHVWLQKPWRAICSQGVQRCVETVIRPMTPCTLKQYLTHSDLFCLTVGCDLMSVVVGVAAPDASKYRSAVIFELPPVMCLPR
jgi:hypothetical protein